MTKRIVFFINHAKPHRVRKTSMNLGIRTEAAILNEKEIDPELIKDALYKGIELFKKISDEILGKLGFNTKLAENNIAVTIPTWRLGDVGIEEDVIEEVARVYGYHKLPSVLPPLIKADDYSLANDPFYWEKRIKNALKYWEFTEVYTYSMVSEEILEGPTKDSVKIKKPLTQDMVYMRKTLVPSLLQVVRENKNRENLKIFELSNVYHPRQSNLPNEITMLAGIIKKENVSFYETKGIIEQLLNDIGIEDLSFT